MKTSYRDIDSLLEILIKSCYDLELTILKT